MKTLAEASLRNHRKQVEEGEGGCKDEDGVKRMGAHK